MKIVSKFSFFLANYPFKIPEHVAFLMSPDHVLGLQTPSTQGYPFISASLSHTKKHTDGQLIRSPSFIPRSTFVISTECLGPVYLLLWGLQPSQASGAIKRLLPFDCLRCVSNYGWNRIIMGKMVLMELYTGKCWPCCCLMYLFIPHTGKCFSNVYHVRLQKRTLTQPHRIPFLAR